jgi:hypothetical protein
MRRRLPMLRLVAILVLGLTLLGPTAAWAQTCTDGQWTATSFDGFPFGKVSTAALSVDPAVLPGAGPLTVTIAGASIDVKVEETFAGAVTRRPAGLRPVTGEATITASAELTGTLVAPGLTARGGPFIASVSGTLAIVANGLTYSGLPITSETPRTFPVSGRFDCATGALQFTSRLVWTQHTLTLHDPSATRPVISDLPAKTAETFADGQYDCEVLDQALLLYRRFGGTSTRELGGFWSRSYYKSGADAKRALALPPGNTAKRDVVIRVHPGITICFGKAAPQPKWGEPGGGDQVVFGPGFKVPHKWIVKPRGRASATRAGDVRLIGLGATRATWNGRHQPDPLFTSAFDPLPDGTFPGAITPDRFDGLIYDRHGRLSQFTEKFVPGTTIAAAKAAVLALLPRDARRVAGPRKLGTCAAEERSSRTLAKQDGKRGIVASYQSYYDFPSVPYVPADVREAWVFSERLIIPPKSFGRGLPGKLLCL